ncbi:transglutaminase family protein cysteine peptidase btlcp [Ahrensia sp. R2A130]|nr:transglutaminase-like cysteine peptidase [Ahrensia sp. R2A130]EFL90464.1 transglutaminase family protein cysteine peptidase btlcp [Ahrensia sp. R2A130]
MMTTMKRLGTTLGALVLLGATATTSFAATAHMNMGGNTSQPIGHAYFCQQLPQECAVRTKNAEPMRLTKKRWRELTEINAYANAAVSPVTDQDFYGVEEHWTYPKSYGDCEDYVLLKRYMLMQKGWPASSLLITVVKQANGEGHAVLTVRTDRGDFALDNLRGKVSLWSKTPYQYLKRQSRFHSGRWTSIKDRRSQVAGY